MLRRKVVDFIIVIVSKEREREGKDIRDYKKF